MKQIKSVFNQYKMKILYLNMIQMDNVIFRKKPLLLINKIYCRKMLKLNYFQLIQAFKEKLM